jgi:hypothetical protein
MLLIVHIIKRDSYPTRRHGSDEAEEKQVKGMCPDIGPDEKV